MSEELKAAKSSYKQFKKSSPAYAESLRTQMASQIVNSRTPNWGSVKVTVTKHGI